MDIKYAWLDYRQTWVAWDADRYDGAPDAGPQSRVCGEGRTKQEAETDLRERLEEFA